jgi:succinate-semialdehyde dehydrogenase/glutarate-semialdehyde dehydrogenase
MEKPRYIFSPTTGEPVAEIKEQSAEDLKQAVGVAALVQSGWQTLSYRKKKRCAEKAAAYIRAHADRIARAVSECTGKTRIDALGTDVLPAAMACRYYAKIAGKVLKPEKLGRSSILFFNKGSWVRRRPYGVVGIISPWNYPFGIPMHEVISGLLAGNGVVLKTATQTQPVGDLIAETIEAADFPDGLFHLIHMPGPAAGKAFMDSGIGKLFFTGSTETGKELMREAARSLLPVSLELGGKDAMIVLRDAPLERAASGAVWAGVGNCGQSCGGVERIYVEKIVYGDFLRLLKKKVAALRQGPDTDFSVDFGPLTSSRQKKIVEDQVKEAVEGGAEIVASSVPPPSAAESAGDGENLFHPALVIEKAGDHTRLMREETFGPVLTVEPVEDWEEAVRKANDGLYGLTASVWTLDAALGDKVSALLEAGVVTLNDHLMSHGMAETPWGGIKNSGIGRCHGRQGIEEMTWEQTVVKDLFPRIPRNIFWYPHSPMVYEGLSGAMDFLFSRSLFRKICGAAALIRLFLDRLKPG